MNKKQVIRINEPQLTKIINESVNHILNEYSVYDDYDDYPDEEMCNQIAYDAHKLYEKMYSMKNEIDNLRFISGKKQAKRRQSLGKQLPSDFNQEMEFSDLYNVIERNFENLLNSIAHLSHEASTFAHGNGAGVIHMDGVVK